jgi:hypothetical protein
VPLLFAACALFASPEARIEDLRADFRSFDGLDATFATANERLALEHTRVVAEARGRVAVLPLDHDGRRYLRDADGLAWAGAGLHESLERAPGLDELAGALWSELRGGFTSGRWTPGESPPGAVSLLPGLRWSVLRPSIERLPGLEIGIALARFRNAPTQVRVEVGGYSVHVEVTEWALDEPLSEGLFSPAEWPK